MAVPARPVERHCGPSSRRGSQKSDSCLNPRALTAPYRGTTLSARLEKNGTVSFAGESYTSLSQAGGAARASVIGLRKGGKLPATGGWTFWRYRAPDGTEQEIDHARQAYLHANLRAPSAAAE